MLSNYKSEELNGVLKLKKSYEKVTKENKDLAKNLDYIFKEEIIVAIKKIAKKVDVEVDFTYDNSKNKF